jgi:outer membrane lipoprotein-sorting protein
MRSATRWLVAAGALASALVIAGGIPRAAATPSSTTATRTPAERLAVLDRERSALHSLSFSAAIETPKAGGRVGRSTLTFHFLAPSRYRSEIRMGVEGTLLTVADGTTIWSWESRTRKVFRQDQSIATSRLRSYGPVDPVTALATPSVPLATLFRAVAARDSGGFATLELVPKRSVPNYDRLVVVTSSDGRTLKSAETWHRGKRTARIVFGEIKRNIPPAASLFVYAPPSGVRVVEIR